MLTIARKHHANGLCSQARLDLLHAKAEAAQHAWLPKSVPGAYTVLDPLAVDMDGPAELAWLREPHLWVTPELATAVRKPTPAQMRVIEQMPPEIVSQIRAGHSKVWLSPNICQVCFLDKQPYERYPTPISRHCFDALEFKQDLIAMDRATIRTVKNRILKVTIGNDMFPVTDPQEMKNLAGLFANPSKTLTLFWNHTLQLEWIQPEVGELLNEKKYSFVNDEIRTAYGILPLFTGTGQVSGSIGNNVLSFKGLEERVVNGQEIFLEFAHREVELLKTALAVKWRVKVTFDPLNLRDEVAFRQVLSAMIRDGIIDRRTALETLGYHFPTIKKRMEEQADLEGEGLFLSEQMKLSKQAGEQAEKQAKLAAKLAPPAAPAHAGGGGAKPAAKKPVNGLQTGGKPKGNKLADNNKSQRGKPKLAAARLEHGPDGRPVMVFDREVDDQDRDDIEAALGIASSDMMSATQFEHATGRKVVFVDPWPDLAPAEYTQEVRVAVGVGCNVLAQ